MGKVGVKNETLREFDAKTIKQALTDNGVTPDNFPEMEAFWKLLDDDYVKRGYGSTGHISIPRIHRKLLYKLTTRENTESTAMLKWTGPSPKPGSN